MSLLATSELSHDAVKKHQDTVLSALKVCVTITDHVCPYPICMVEPCLILDTLGPYAEAC